MTRKKFSFNQVKQLKSPLKTNVKLINWGPILYKFGASLVCITFIGLTPGVLVSEVSLNQVMYIHYSPLIQFALSASRLGLKQMTTLKLATRYVWKYISPESKPFLYTHRRRMKPIAPKLNTVFILNINTVNVRVPN